MSKVYCEYCGSDYSSVQAMTGHPCSRHPDGSGKGRHKLYEGAAKPQYTCKYCGSKYSTIATMTGFMCARHPSGTNKGRHLPAL